MRKTIRTSAWLGALLAGAILFTSGGADAHEYFVGKNVPLPTRDDGKRFIQVSVGETVTLTVANAPMQSCSAEIAAVQSSSVIRITSPQAAGPVQTREFKITGEMVGDTEIDITVKGVDPCTEDSHNPIVVQVLPDEAELLKEYAAAGKSEAKLLKASLKFGLSSLGEYSAGVLDAFADGSAAPDVAARGLLEGWYETWGGGFYVARDTLRNLSNFGSSELIARGWPECTSPLRFAEGMGGPFDALRASTRASLDGFYAKLGKQIDSDVAGYRKIGLGYGISFSGGYRLNPYPDIDVSGSTVSPRPADPDAPLRIGYVGGVSWATEFDTMSCFAVAGIASPGSGPVRIELWDGAGLVGSKLAPIEGQGVWDVMFDDLLAGKTYRATAKYEGGAPGHDTSKTFLPGLRLNF